MRFKSLACSIRKSVTRGNNSLFFIYIWWNFVKKAAALTSQNIGSFLAKSTTRVMAGVIIFVNWLKASISTLFPSGVLTMDAWPISSGWNNKEIRSVSGLSQSLNKKIKPRVKTILLLRSVLNFASCMKQIPGWDELI